MIKSEPRSPALDGVRGVAILLVLFWHLYACVPHPQWTQNFIPFDWLANMGWSGVILFFVLSGFLIARILLRHRQQPRYFSTFYIRRTARIIPLYYLCLGSFLLVRHWLPSAENPPLTPLLDNHSIALWPYAIFVQNYAMAQINHFGGAWLGVTWSLAIEEQFYLLLPLLIAIAPRR
jgi:peptidoglycan/LPS O-acetylase OafA/YrhL